MPSHRIDEVTVLLGVRMLSYDDHLDQPDFVAIRGVCQTEQRTAPTGELAISEKTVVRRRITVSVSMP